MASHEQRNAVTAGHTSAIARRSVRQSAVAAVWRRRVQWVANPRRVIAGGLFVILAVMPFHAPLVLGLGHVLGHGAVWHAWKEALILALTLIAAWQVARVREWRQRLRPWLWPLGTFVLMCLAVTLLQRSAPGNLLFGLKIDLEFLVAFVLAVLVGQRRSAERAVGIVVATSAAVGTIAIVQASAWPDMLGWLGYGPATIRPYLYVDPTDHLRRVLSTLGGPNQLGGFMVLPLCLSLYALLKQRSWRHGALVVVLTVTLVESFSRSAWVGAVVALGVTAVLAVRWPARWWVATMAVSVALIVPGVWGASHTTGGWAVLAHLNPQSAMVYNSTAGHVEALLNGLDAVRRHPLGSGLGTAGPATSSTGHPLITESFYLQLAVETSVVGLLAFVVLLATLAVRLYRQRGVSWSTPVLGALIGLSVVNAVLHGWADSSTALVFWTMAGLVGAGALPGGLSAAAGRRAVGAVDP
jgi:hypothetical protein